MDWVPRCCRLTISYDQREGWSGSLRLIDDYLGYLVCNTNGATAEEVVAAVRGAFEEGMRNLAGLDVATKSYYRRVAA